MRTGLAKLITTAISACVLLASCSGEATYEMGNTGLRLSSQLDRQSSIGAEGVELALVSLGTVDGHEEFSLRASGLDGTKALYGRLLYNPQAMHFAASSEDALSDGAIRLFIVSPAEKSLHFGWVLTNFDSKAGLSGELEVGRVRFAEGAATGLRGVSAPPSGGGENNQFELSGEVNENGEPVLTWPDTNDGDGDNNGLVTIADLTPIGQQFGKAVPAPEATDYLQVLKADYDHNTLVNISDLTPIGINFGKQLFGYVVLSGLSEVSLGDEATLLRSEEFPTIGVGDGLATWDWTGEVLTETTFYQVVPVDAQGNRGRASENIVQLDPTIVDDVVTGLAEITFAGSETWPQDAQGNYIVLLSELSVDSTDGNSEAFAPELLDLSASFELNDDPQTTRDGTEESVWILSEGAGLATISNQAGSKGDLSFNNRGLIEITAQVSGSPLMSETIGFVLLSIESLELTLAGGGAGPSNVASGTDVGFTATGTFDWDGVANGNEVEQDLTDSCNWALLPDAGNTGSFSIDTLNGVLNTDDGDSGDSIRVACEFPRTDVVTLYDNQKRASEFITVNIN